MARVGFTKTWPHEDGLYERLPYEAFMLFRKYILQAGFVEHSYVAPDADDPTSLGDFCFYCSSDAFELDEDRPRYRMVLPPAWPGNYQLVPGEIPIIYDFAPRQLYLFPETPQWDGSPPVPDYPALDVVWTANDFMEAVQGYQGDVLFTSDSCAVQDLTDGLKGPYQWSSPDADTVLSAVFDGRSGSGFISIQKGEFEHWSTGKVRPAIAYWALTRQRRLPVDGRPDVASMFGIAGRGNFARPINRRFFDDPDADRSTWCFGDIFSPLFGMGDVSEAAEGDGYIPLRMLAPIFAAGPYRSPFVYAGELLDVMAAGDGFADGDVPIPGWRIFRPDGGMPLALPWPDVIVQE